MLLTNPFEQTSMILQLMESKWQAFMAICCKTCAFRQPNSPSEIFCSVFMTEQNIDPSFSIMLST